MAEEEKESSELNDFFARVEKHTELSKIQDNETNKIKKTCKILNITQKELAEILGVSKPTVERWAQSGEIPEQAIKQIALLVENYQVKQELNELKTAIKVIAKHAH